MARHSSDGDGQISQFMEETFRKRADAPTEDRIKELLGATRQFPQGKLAPSDEGELKFAVGAKDGKVVIEFGKPVAWMGMDAEQAISLAELLIEKAARCGVARMVRRADKV